MAITPNMGYNGNPHLPKSNSSYSYTPEQEIEIAKCMMDPVYFAETYFKIVSVDDGLIPFKLYDFQKEAARAYITERKMILATSRQIGKTSIATVIVLHYALFNEHKTVFILANKADTALEILSRIQLAYQHLPNWLKSGVIEWNKSSVEFDNGSKIKARATSSDNIRGQSANFLYIDECIGGETFVTIRDKNSGKEFKVTMEKLYIASSIDNLLINFKSGKPQTFSNKMKNGAFAVIARKTLKKYINKYGENYSEIFYNIENPEINPVCEYCGKNHNSFIGYDIGYSRYCNKKCSGLDPNKVHEDMRKIGGKKRSITLKNIYNDTIKGTELKNKLSKRGKEYYKNNTEAREKISIRVKKSIADGKFTPNITNSWTRWSIKINNKKFRSSFEGLFYLYYSIYKNDSYYEYEKLRIPYNFENKDRTYIVDFINNRTKEVFEIKPESLKDDDKNQAKFLALSEWCINNNYSFNLITEKELKEMLLEMDNDKIFYHSFIHDFKKVYKKWII